MDDGISLRIEEEARLKCRDGRWMHSNMPEKRQFHQQMEFSDGMLTTFFDKTTNSFMYFSSSRPNILNPLGGGVGMSHLSFDPVGQFAPSSVPSL